MNNIPTPHIEAKDSQQIAKTVLMSGDPLRAKHIAETFLTEATQFNQVRGMFGFTGKYKNKLISVMGHGMGMPSMGIYSYELFKFYQVEEIIRMGSAGAYHKDLNLYDIVLVDSAWSPGNYAKEFANISSDTLYPTAELNQQLLATAAKLDVLIKPHKIHTTEAFYRENTKADYYQEILQQHGCMAVEMETFALFANAQVLNKKAACLLTISDSLVTHQETTSLERQKSFNKMVELALESCSLKNSVAA